MPYIKQIDRDCLTFDVFKNIVPQNAGELNFLFSMLIKAYIEDGTECYQKYNDVIGALEGAKLEIYRRKIAPYEDEKILMNGDIY